MHSCGHIQLSIQTIRNPEFVKLVKGMMVCSHRTTPRMIPRTIQMVIIMGSTVICRAFHTTPRPCNWCHWLLFTFSLVSLQYRSWCRSVEHTIRKPPITITRQYWPWSPSLFACPGAERRPHPTPTTKDRPGRTGQGKRFVGVPLPALPLWRWVRNPCPVLPGDLLLVCVSALQWPLQLWTESQTAVETLPFS